jgi:hypothetical protein
MPSLSFIVLVLMLVLFIVDEGNGPIGWPYLYTFELDRKIGVNTGMKSIGISANSAIKSAGCIKIVLDFS